MKKEEVLFAELIAIGAELKEKRKIDFNSVDIPYILELGRIHSVQGLLYVSLKHCGVLDFGNESMFEEYKREIFRINLMQKKNEAYITKVFNALLEGNIDFLTMKGAVLRQYYPISELRTMCDIDILVKKEDLERTGYILEKLGYNKGHGEAPHHFQYEKQGYPVVEVHWDIVKSTESQNELGIYENSIWERAMAIDIYNLHVRTFGREDFLLHLIMHMASHMTGGGFGIRQLADLNLYIKNNGSLINWNKVENQCKNTGHFEFACAILLVSEDFFGIEIPSGFINININNKKYIKSLKEEIISAGVYGRNDVAGKFGNQLAFNYSGRDSSTVSGVAVRFAKFIFPGISGLSEGYSYARKYKILLPVAWVHHLLKGVFIKDYSIKDKFAFIFKAPLVSLRKNKLLKWLRI